MKVTNYKFRVAVFIAMFMAFFAISPAIAAKVEVISKLEAYTVQIGKSGKEKLKKAKRVTPGGVIEYRISYENNTDAALNNFIVNGEVPSSTAYMGETQYVNQSAVFEAEITDLGWREVPVFREVTNVEGRVERVEVPANEYQNVRWRVKNPVAPGGSVQAVYRIKVDR